MVERNKQCNNIHTDNNNIIMSEDVMFETIMQCSSDSIYFKDRECRFICVNKKIAERHGINDPSEMIGKTDFDFISESNAKEIFASEMSIIETGHPIIGKIEKIVRLDGSTSWTSASKYPLYGKTGEIAGIWGISRDITEYELAKEALLKSEKKHKTMIENISGVITIIDRNWIVKYRSPNSEKYFGWTSKDLEGTDIRNLLYHADLEKANEAFCSLMNRQGSVALGEYRCRCKDGTYRTAEVTAVNLIDDVNIEGVLLNYHDISEQKKREEEIIFLNYHDVLTCLYNRTFFDEECRRLDTVRNLPVSVIMGDINGLKLINDAFGHAEGDKFLIEMARILKSCCREEDIVARIGGDEFCILLPQTASESAQKICDRIHAACDVYKFSDCRKSFSPSIALGYSTKMTPSESVESLQKQAEDAMYRRKLLQNRSMHSSIISSIRSTMLEKSYDTEEHSERMIALSAATGKALHLPLEQLFDLELLSRLHDIGKISIDEHILMKPGKLTEEEFDEIRKHPAVGYRIAQASPDLSSIAYGILCHHERWDGSGYPQGLSGEDIPLLSRIITVVDAYDAMTQDRPYRKAMPIEAAIEEIVRHAGGQFDPHIARVFVEEVIGETWESC